MKRTWLVFLAAALVLATALAACGDDDDDNNTSDDDAGDDDNDAGDDDDDDTGGFRLMSSEFEDGGEIPGRFTCDGDDVSPPLAWINPPPAAVAFALAVIDRDTQSGETPHWGLINIPADIDSLEEALSPGGDLPEGAWETKNYSGDLGYAGPCPPASDDPHMYVFSLYGLVEPIPDPGEETELSDVMPLVTEAQVGRAGLAGFYDRE